MQLKLKAQDRDKLSEAATKLGVDMSDIIRIGTNLFIDIIDKKTVHSLMKDSAIALLNKLNKEYAIGSPSRTERNLSETIRRDIIVPPELKKRIMDIESKLIGTGQSKRSSQPLILRAGGLLFADIINTGQLHEEIINQLKDNINTLSSTNKFYPHNYQKGE